MAPENAGTQYFNHKGTNSISFMGVCDASYSFTLIDVCSSGCYSDGAVLAHSTFAQANERWEVNYPPQSHIPGTDIALTHMIVGDAAFPSRVDLTRP